MEIGLRSVVSVYCMVTGLVRTPASSGEVCMQSIMANLLDKHNDELAHEGGTELRHGRIQQVKDHTQHILQP